MRAVALPSVPADRFSSPSPLALLSTGDAAGADNASQLQPAASLHPSASCLQSPTDTTCLQLATLQVGTCMHRGRWRTRGRQLWRVWGECFCAPLCAEGLHIPHMPAPRGAALSPAPMTDPCHHHFPAAQGCSAASLDDGKLQLALSCCCATPNQSTAMHREAEAGPLYAASSSQPQKSALSSRCPQYSLLQTGLSQHSGQLHRHCRVGWEPREGVHTVPSWTKRMGVKSRIYYIHLC